MADEKDMPRVVFDDSEQMRSARAYAKYLETKNFARAVRARKLLIQKRITLGVCCTLAIAAYGFTIFKVKQETFLDDFDEPPRVVNPSQSK